MPFTYSPPFPQKIWRKSVSVTATTVPTSGAPTNTVAVDQVVGAFGGVCTRIKAMPTGTGQVPSGGIAVALFLTSTGTSVARYIGQAIIPTGFAISNPGVKFEFTESAPLRLEAGDKFSFGLMAAFAGGVDVTVEWSDF